MCTTTVLPTSLHRGKAMCVYATWSVVEGRSYCDKKSKVHQDQKKKDTLLFYCTVLLCTSTHSCVEKLLCYLLSATHEICEAVCTPTLSDAAIHNIITPETKRKIIMMLPTNCKHGTRVYKQHLTNSETRTRSRRGKKIRQHANR